MKKQKKYPPAFKARVALEALKEEKTIAQISAEYEIHSNLVSKWKKQLKDNITTVFFFIILRRKLSRFYILMTWTQ